MHNGALMPAGGTRVMKFSWITVNVQQMDGLPCIRGLRIPVAAIVAMVADNMENTEILKAHPDLTRWTLPP